MNNFIIVKEYVPAENRAFQHAINRNIILQVVGLPPEAVTAENPANCVVRILMGAEPQNLFVLDSFNDITEQLNRRNDNKRK